MLIAEQGTGVRTVTAGNIRRGGELVSDRSGSGRNTWLRAGTTASLIYFMANKANGRVPAMDNADQPSPELYRDAAEKLRVRAVDGFQIAGGPGDATAAEEIR